MDFDHVRGAKEMAVAKMVHETCSKRRISSEIAKCELVCVLCHKTRTHKRRATSGHGNHASTASHRRQRIFQLVNEAKSVPCTACGVSRPYWQMEFDHLPDNQKRACVSTLVVLAYSEKTVMAEIAKCRVLCALCHRRSTFRERGYKSASASIEPF